MMIRAYSLLLASAVALGGCATTSFAPAPLNVHYEGEAATNSICYVGGRGHDNVTVSRTVAGATKLLDTMIDAYRCAGHSAANGRQLFEIPAFLATTGAAAAVALGGGPAYGIAGTAANAAFNSGKAYWDPKAKAGIFDHSLDALLCIKAEAMGVNHFLLEEVAKKDRTANDALRTKNRAGEVTGGSVMVTADAQYFALVSAAALSVERVLAQRLSNVGTFDASSVAAEIERAVQAAKDAKKDQTDPPTNPNEAKAYSGMTSAQQSEAAQRKAVELDLAAMQPRLQKCVTYAKL